MLTGSGDKAFAAGADIKEMADKPAADFYLDDFFARWTSRPRQGDPQAVDRGGERLRAGRRVRACDDGGLHHRESDKAKFGQPEIKLGVAPGMGGSQRLTRAVGKAKAMEMCLTGRMMDAEEAERSGLVARVVPHDELLDETLKTAAAIAAMPPMAVIANKEMVNVAFEIDPRPGADRRAPHLPDPRRHRRQGRGHGRLHRKARRAVEGAVILKGLGLIGFGLLFIWLGITSWRNRREDRISIIEAAILKVADAEPLPFVGGIGYGPISSRF